MAKVKCLNCWRIIESKFRHDFKQCKCDNQTFVDYDPLYTRYGGKHLYYVLVIQ